MIYGGTEVKKRKLIGILTFVNADNFGAVLQAYALSQYCGSQGYDVEFINYRTNLPQSTSSKSSQHKKETIFQKILRRSKFIKNYHRNVQIRKFLDFRNTLLVMGKTLYQGDQEFLENYQDKYDFVICGSDQIWNTQLSNASKTFYLDFESKAKKVAYAGSYGHDRLSETERQYTQMFIPKIDSVSCREKESITEIKELCPDTDVEWVVDPVFLLSKDMWDQIIEKPKERNYIFVYTMEDSQGMRIALENIRKQNPNKKIISVVGGCCDNPPNTHVKKEIGPKEFVGLIACADVVITNSFHATAFSIIYSKKLCLVEHTTRNLRLRNIMEAAGIGGQEIVTNDGVCDCIATIDTHNALGYLQKNIEASKGFLRKALR